MNGPILWALSLFAAMWALWVIFAAVMRLKQVRSSGRLTEAQKVFGYLTLFVGLVLDFLVNFSIGSAVFLELPREWTLSARLWRLSTGAVDGWRRRLALVLRTELLDSIDPEGVHRG